MVPETLSISMINPTSLEVTPEQQEVWLKNNKKKVGGREYTGIEVLCMSLILLDSQ